MEDLADIRFTGEYPPEDKQIPLRQITVAVGLEKVEIKDSFKENDQGILEYNEYCRQARLRIRLSIHVPFALGGELCHDCFADIIDCLSFASDLNILSSGCGVIKADRDTEALVLDAFIELTADFCPAVSSALNFKSFLDKELLCGSHIRDWEIHVGKADRELWTEPFVTGRYFGSQVAGRSFDLGFKPKFVAVCAEGCPPFSVDFEKGESYFYSASAIVTAGGRGLEIKEKGFKVFNGPAHADLGAVPRLNEAGFSYFYIAFK